MRTREKLLKHSAISSFFLLVASLFFGRYTSLIFQAPANKAIGYFTGLHNKRLLKILLNHCMCKYSYRNWKVCIHRWRVDSSTSSGEAYALTNYVTLANLSDYSHCKLSDIMGHLSLAWFVWIKQHFWGRREKWTSAELEPATFSLVHWC